MKHSHFRRLLLALCLSLAAVNGQAANTTQLALNLPQLPSPESSLAVELGGYDVTPFATIADGQLQLRLDMALAPGDYELQVLAFAPNGDIQSLLDQVLTITAPSEPSGQWSSQLSLDSSYRLDASEPDDYQAARHLASQGGWALRAAQLQDNLSLTVELDALYDSTSENLGNNTGTEWALPSYRIEARHQGATLSAGAMVGNVRIEQQDLLFSMFQRRGAEVRIGNASQSTELRLFKVNSEPSTRVDEALVLPGQTLRGQGATLNTHLAGDALMLKLGYVDGKTQLGGAGVYAPGDPVVYGGDSWNLGLDSYLMEQSIWLHAEYAESRFDSDGIDLGADAEQDSALQLLARLQSGALPTGPLDYWTATLQHQKVGAQFYSLGNLTLPGDVALNRLVTQLGRQSINLNFEWSSEQNNQADDPALPTQTLARQMLTVNYVPMLEPGSALAVLGAPSATLYISETQHSQPDSNAQTVGFDLDNLTHEQSVSVNFSQSTWSWGLQWASTRFDDRSEAVSLNGYDIYQPGSDMENRMLGLNMSWMPSTRANVNLFTQFNRQTQTDLGDTYYNRNLGIDTLLQLIPEKLVLSLNYNYGADRSELANPAFIEDDFLSHFGNGQLTWMALAAKGNTPGVNVYLRGSYGRQDNRAFAWAQEQWSAHAGIELAWSAGDL
ncbi:hypothetical protein L1F30_05240 [Simiduia sp. 21SJ11W-1]|uniref:hypothetical protein n=1 Tax=Simiduia sp. 21SJ11W-1 TaxID=2909669 RepID=UPI0020A0029B|nr:hypothetical protein [Simiduia sp. 21SJ11W-1]UTA48951.1 hypothetical protein L1F30_05240 [Simiduia sp. 21SJ11W-1]